MKKVSMTILFDTNIILDVLLNRLPFATASALVWHAVEQGPPKGMLAAHSVTTIFCIVQKQRGNSVAKQTIASLLQVFGVSRVDDDVLQAALLLP